MVNLIAGRRIVPELLQSRFTAENVAAELAPLLQDSPERARQITALAEVRKRLTTNPGAPAPGVPGDFRRWGGDPASETWVGATAIDRVAAAVLDLLAHSPASPV